MRAAPRRVALSPSIGPTAALWLWRHNRDELLRAAVAFEQRGSRLVAGELRAAADQLAAAAAQVRQEDLLPPMGSAEAFGSETGGESGTSSLTFMGVAEVAEMLNLTPRRITQLLDEGVLSGTQRARGSVWRVDRASVETYRDLRSAP